MKIIALIIFTLVACSGPVTHTANTTIPETKIEIKEMEAIKPVLDALNTATEADGNTELFKGFNIVGNKIGFTVDESAYETTTITDRKTLHEVLFNRWHRVYDEYHKTDEGPVIMGIYDTEGTKLFYGESIIVNDV